MLDRSKLLRELQNKSDQLFYDSGPAFDVARASWERILADSFFYLKAQAASTPWSIPLWQEALDKSYPVAQNIPNYCVLSVDGSQIYPDKHQGTSCYLINIGLVELMYAQDTSRVQFLTEPHFFAANDTTDLFQSGGIDLVNCRRQEFEFLAGYEWCKDLKSRHGDMPIAMLFDGSLIFWHLESKEPEIKHQFLTSYLVFLQQFYDLGIPIAGYVSLPKSKDILNLVRLELCNFNVSNSDVYKPVDMLVDTCVASFFLEPYTRSILFQSTSPITKLYPDHLRPYFFYLHVGNEIARVEIPAWIAQDVTLVDQLSSIMLDQTIKGRGYPVALAEAHEQAVVKGPDREFFYHLIQKMGIEQRRKLSMSPKSMKKRGLGI
jgi:hypothetical protein